MAFNNKCPCPSSVTADTSQHNTQEASYLALFNTRYVNNVPFFRMIRAFHSAVCYPLPVIGTPKLPIYGIYYDNR